MSAGSRYALVGAVFVALLVGALVLYSHPPSSTPWYPKCQLYQLTGWYCSGCGATRATFALLHGRLEEAARMNVLAVVVLPMVVVFAMRSLWRWAQGGTARSSAPSPWLAILVAVVLIGFGVVRNLPWPPFTWLAPH